ncbi:Uncharacterised protein [Serratia ficaria]|nr:Uncharacterised protein [Serratia ficaria]CAI1042923.1 Uncharacterised protein [Serratia ficaria]CAI1790107.1 Uncharacterised protein [Serratia ficaria]CAI2400593.1 Uncharacterised protein [Serratia ficaria]CAI2421127.1 Uncharacterised protein [Serratia ficaria]
MNLIKRFLSRGIAGVSDCIILATIGFILWFLLISESEFRFIFAGISCLGFVAAFLVYKLADKIHDGI